MGVTSKLGREGRMVEAGRTTLILRGNSPAVHLGSEPGTDLGSTGIYLTKALLLASSVPTGRV